MRLAREEATRKWFPASNSAREVLPQPVTLRACTCLCVLAPAGDMFSPSSCRAPDRADCIWADFSGPAGALCSVMRGLMQFHKRFTNIVTTQNWQ